MDFINTLKSYLPTSNPKHR